MTAPRSKPAVGVSVPARCASLSLAVVLVAIACAPPRLKLPSGPGAPLADPASVLQRATAGCRNVHSLTAEIALSGRVGGRRLRARLFAGLAAPDALRLEAVAPFGPPVFVLVARGGRATLVLPRDERVLTGEPPEAILDALAGVRVAPAELRAMLTGCVAPDPQAVDGRQYESAWAAIDLGSGGTVYLRSEAGGWRLAAARTHDHEIEYAHAPDGSLARVRLRSIEDDPGRASVDLSVVLSQVETNRPIDPEAFTLDVPENAAPLSLDELREAGPLGGAGTRESGGP